MVKLATERVHGRLRRLTGGASGRNIDVGRVSALVLQQVGSAGRVQIVEVVVPTPLAVDALHVLVTSASPPDSCASSFLFLVGSQLAAVQLAAAQPTAERSD